MTLARGKNLKDLTLKETKALPAAAGAVNLDSIDTQNGPNGSLDGVDLILTAPALNATELPSAKTMTYKLQDSADDSSFSDVNGYEQICKQTGGTSGAAAAETVRITLPPTIGRYIRVVATGGTGIGDCSGSSMTVELAF
jgi:hypothetical protein